MKTKKSLYREMLRQQQICGLVFAICAILTEFCIFIVYAAAPDNFFTPIEPQFLNLFSYFIMFVGGITFPLVGFSYLNKRNSADIMHSIPVSRMQLFVATGGAVITWLVLLQVATWITSAIGYAILGVPFSLLQALCGFINMTIATITIAAGTMIAVAISGSTLSALAASLVINFVPRLILTGFAANLVSNQMLAIDKLGLLSPQYNLIFGNLMGYLFSSFFGVSQIEHLADSVTKVGIPTLYTLLLGVVYLALAVLLFNKRKSEAAGNPAVNRLAQHIIRCGVASPFLIGMMMSYRSNHGYHFSEATTWIIVLISFGVYVIYELLCKRSFKQTVKTIPLFAGMAIIILISGPISGKIGDMIAKKTVTAGEIESVCFDGRLNMYPMDNNYNQAKHGRIQFTNEQIKELTVKALNQTIKDHFISDSIRSNTTILRVDIHAGMHSFTRYIRYDKGDFIKLVAAIEADEQVKVPMNDLPSVDELLCVRATSDLSYDNLSSEEANELWTIAAEEYKNLTDIQKFKYYELYDRDEIMWIPTTQVADSQYPQKQNVTIGTITGYGVKHGKSYSIRLRIGSMFPKTVTKLLQRMQSEQGTDGLKDFLQKAQQENAALDWSLEYINPQGSTAYADNLGRYDMDEKTVDIDVLNYEFSLDYTDSTDLFGTLEELSKKDSTERRSTVMPDAAIQDVLDWLMKQDNLQIDLNKGYYRLHVSYYGSDSYELCFSK